MISGFLMITIGINFLLIGYNIVKMKWKDEKIKMKHESKFRKLGFLFLIFGIFRIILN